MPKKIIHTSLFPNTNCVVCNKKVKDNALHCKGCLSKWIESKNNVVLPAVRKCECKYNQGIISVCKSCIDSADIFAA